MALSLLLGGSREYGFKKSGLTDFAFELDLILSERHTMRSEVTRFPIEEGAEIADHVIKQPKRIQLTGLVSNTPVQILGGLSFEDRVQNAIDVLEQLREDKEIVTVVSGLKVYSDMIFTELIYPRDNITGQALEFRAILDEITKVELTTVLIPSATNSGQASPEQNVGSQSTTPEE
jgi:hypothetical protein